MSLLVRYLTRQNLFLLSAILLAGVGLYVLTDLFERLDSFLENDNGLALLLLFFSMKIPTIISQILPAVFMLSLVVQLNLLERSRELTALKAGGISPLVLLRFVVFYGCMLGLLQFACAQVLGVAGERTASRIWQEEVRGKVLADEKMQGIWFMEKNSIIHMGTVYPVQKRGMNIVVYTLDETGSSITEIIKAKRFDASDGKKWRLEEGERLTPATYTATAFTTLELPVRQDLRTFQVAAHSGGIKPNQLSLRELKENISRLERAGSNVEGLRTAWHGKISYACSLVVMGLLALLVSRLTPNIYRAVGLSLLIVFFFYGANTMGMALGEKGVVTPFVGAWMADLFFLLAGLAWLILPEVRGLLRR